MAISVPERYWWRQPFTRDERIWVTIALIWCLFLTSAMPLWHIYGTQNASKEYYRISGEDYDKLTDRFIKKYKQGEEGDIPVVAPPPNTDIFLRASQWAWEPVLKLKLNRTYRLHLGSLDVNHGFSILPINMNFEVVPGWEHILQITPTQSGEFSIMCNEFCGIGHHTMVGKIIIEP